MTSSPPIHPVAQVLLRCLALKCVMTTKVMLYLTRRHCVQQSRNRLYFCLLRFSFYVHYLTIKDLFRQVHYKVFIVNHIDLVSRFIEVLLPWQLIADYQLIFHPLLKIATLLLSKRRASAGQLSLNNVRTPVVTD